jgi:hypothetical protein
MIPCIHPRADKEEAEAQRSLYGGILPAASSFQQGAEFKGSGL